MGSERSSRDERIRYETRIGPSEDPSVAVIEAVAEVSGCSSEDLPERLFAVTDPDALDEVLSHCPDAGLAEVEFAFCGYRVTVTRGGRLQVADGQ